VTAAAHGLLDVADAGAFLARLTRLDRSTLVRLRPAAASGAGDEPRTALWARLPWQVLVTRTVRGPGPGEATVSAADLLAGLAEGSEALPARRDTDWRWPLPPDAGRAVERITAEELVRVGRAAAGTLRNATATRQVGERMVRDALLDHVAILVTGDEADLEVPQRLVQAVLRMGFIGPSTVDTEGQVQVRISGKWTGLAAPYGTAWLRVANEFMVTPVSTHPFG
jgi:hypothetical protein